MRVAPGFVVQVAVPQAQVPSRQEAKPPLMGLVARVEAKPQQALVVVEKWLPVQTFVAVVEMRVLVAAVRPRMEHQTETDWWEWVVILPELVAVRVVLETQRRMEQE
jgi:hypothetical protein